MDFRMYGYLKYEITFKYSFLKYKNYFCGVKWWSFAYSWDMGQMHDNKGVIKWLRCMTI